jgi:dTDP-4-dehydrorhamnose 3,5-epimerase-like enzyme
MVNPSASIQDVRGKLTSINIEWDVKRVFWVTNVPAGEVRGFHAHRTGNQVLFCLAGAILAKFEDDQGTEVIELLPEGFGVSMKNLVWGEQTFIEPNSVLLVLASNEYDEQDYIRDRAEFEELSQKRK